MAARPGDAPLDNWSLVHLVSGFGLGFVTASWPLAFALLVAFEVLEAGFRRVRRGGAGLFEYESWQNIVMDLVVGLVGYWAARFVLQASGQASLT